MNGAVWLARQLVRALVGGVAFIAVLVGMPWVLLRLTRRVLADPPDVAALVDEPLSAATLVLLAVAGAWVFWGWLLVGAVLEAVDRVRRPARPRLRPPAPLYASVSAVVGTVTLLLDGFAARGAVDPHPAADTPAAASTLPRGGRQVRAEAPMAAQGIDVVGAGWLPLPAAAAGAVSAWIWAQRRRQYQPQPPRGAHRDDADLIPLPGRFDADSRVTIGVADGRWLDLADLPAGGVRLTGLGAHSALRGLLVTVLAAAAGSSSSGPAVVIAADDQRRLLGVDAAAAPGLHVVDSSETVTAVGVKLAEAGQPVLVVYGEAGPARGWLDAVGRAGLTVVGVGAGLSLPPHPGVAGPVQQWRVSADGTVAATGARLAVLNAAAAAVVLAGLRHTAPRSAPVSLLPDTALVADLPDPGAAAASAAVRRLRVAVLGPVRIEHATADGAGTVQLRRTASLHLLLLLAVHRDGITGDDLVAALWPDQLGHTGARKLATNLSELRKVLQHAAGVDIVHRSAVLAGGSRYRLDPAHVEVDLWQFHDLIDAAHSAAGPAARRALLRQAADLDRGELAEDLTGAWLAAVREATARHCIDVLTYLADAETDHSTALALLHHAARRAPDNEAVQRAVLRRHAAAGDLDGVHRVYTALRERCSARADIPEPATTDLYEDLTAEHPVTASTGGGATERTPR